MGGTYSKQVAIKNIATAVTVDVLVRNTTSADSSVTQSNEINITGSQNILIDLAQENAAKVDLSVASTMTMDGTLQQQITASIIDKLSTDQNVIGLGLSDVEVSTIVSNEVSTYINVENVTKLATAVSQANRAIISGDSNTAISAVNQKNTADAVMKLASDMSTSIAQNLISTSDAKTDATTKQTNPISDFLSSNMLLIVIVVIVIIAMGVGGWYYLNHFDDGLFEQLGFAGKSQG